ncbi:hypothetical protein [Herbaspirillum sp. RV1423]|uniref:hypothetical protein n=1 Tax=Herbaspirillum sp. RV1423 TaxID=1443993 RepID=UPI0012DD6F5F|nr:hypothetical protein [Herbaspirillum sp. RV1423]
MPALNDLIRFVSDQEGTFSINSILSGLVQIVTDSAPDAKEVHKGKTRSLVRQRQASPKIEREISYS